jgi:two-component system sensor histidine kinase ChvG
MLVMGVPLRLERILENLLDNAVSFSPENGTIEVRVARRDDFVETSVCDQGPGIPAEAREKVFMRFNSLRPEAEDFGQHSGLGLAIGRAIAEAHDGTLVVREPENGTGACLVLTLPAA